jgi:hypothetical protein
VYGEKAIDLTQEAAAPEGWTIVEVFQYGRSRKVEAKVIDATWEVTRGRVRVVIVKTPKKREGWRAFGTTNVEMSVSEVLETAAARTAIEGGFRDMKQESGACEQQVRRVWQSVGAFHVVMWTQTLTRLTTWETKEEPQRGQWDRTGRRASVAERRRMLRIEILRSEFLAGLGTTALPPHILAVLDRLLHRLA